MNLVCRKAAEAVNEAIRSIQPAHLRVASGEIRGRIAYNYYAPDLYDRRMGVLQAIDADTAITQVDPANGPGHVAQVTSSDFHHQRCQ